MTSVDPDIRTLRDRERGLVEVVVYPRPPTGRATHDLEYHIHWGEHSALFVFGMTEVAYVSKWVDWPQHDRDFAFRRLGMTHLRERVLSSLQAGGREELILTAEDDQHFDAAERRSGIVVFSDYPEADVDGMVRADICFALKQRGFVRGKRVRLVDLPQELLSNFWTAVELERNILDLEDEGLLGLQFLSGKVEHGVPQHPIEALGLTREGERRSAQLMPRQAALYDAIHGRPEDEALNADREDVDPVATSSPSTQSATKGSGKAPLVFISYSHDSREHRQWVAEFAAALRQNGVDVVLDQWDLRLGADLPKFMEDGLRRADRVLVICTPDYVRKVDAGEGGAGYEGMLITGELVKNLGTTKFVPVLRASDGDQVLPACLATRCFIDFRDDAKAADRLEELLTELHGKAGAEKPPLGPSPFAGVGHPPPPQMVAAPSLAMEHPVGGTGGDSTQSQSDDHLRLLTCMKGHGGVVAVSRTLSGVGLCFVGGTEEPRLVHGTFGSMGGVEGYDFTGVRWDIMLKELAEAGLIREYYEDVYVLASADVDPAV